MKRGSKQTDVMTFSLPVQLIAQLRSSIGQGEMSRFATQALQKALEQEQEKLRKEYQAAANDPERKKIVEEWSALDVEGLDDEDQDW